MSEQGDRIAMLSDVLASEARLKSHLAEELAKRDARFDGADARFVAIDARFDAVDARFDAVDARFDAVDARFDRLEGRLTEESVTIRRHFDVMVEKIEAAVKIVAEVNAHHHVVLDNHETRLQKLEGPRRA